MILQKPESPRDLFVAVMLYVLATLMLSGGLAAVGYAISWGLSSGWSIQCG